MQLCTARFNAAGLCSLLLLLFEAASGALPPALRGHGTRYAGLSAACPPLNSHFMHLPGSLLNVHYCATLCAHNSQSFSHPQINNVELQKQQNKLFNVLKQGNDVLKQLQSEVIVFMIVCLIIRYRTLDEYHLRSYCAARSYWNPSDGLRAKMWTLEIMLHCPAFTCECDSNGQI